MQVLTQFPLLKALGWALFNSLWQMAALWLLYSLLMAIFHSAAAHIRHRLALSLLVVGAGWTGVTFFAALLFPESGNSTWLPFLSPAQHTPGWFWLTSRTFMDAMLSYGSSIYLLILTGLLVRYAGHYWHTCKLTRKGLATMPAEFRVFVKSTALQLGIQKPVRAWLSSLIDIPLTLGFLKPVILIPVAMISQLSPQQVEAVLIHELGHIQRKDYLLHLVVTLLEGLFFFNPFSRLLIRQLKREREHCCDDLVLQFKYDPHAYVSALLSLATRHHEVRKLALAATGSSDKLLLERARRILLRQEDNRSRPGTRSLLLLLITGLITALVLYRPLHPSHGSAAATPTSRQAIPASIPSIETSQHFVTASLPAATPHSTIPAHPHQLARHQAHVTRQPNIIEPDEDNIFVNTADDALNYSDNAATPIVVSSDDVTDGTNGSGTDYRDYSLNMPATIAGPSITIQQGAPIVPNSSFSFQYTLADSSQKEEQQLYLQQSAQLEVLDAIAKLQQQTAIQLKALADLEKTATESVHLRQQIRTRQLKLREDYEKKISTWQHKLEKATHMRVIVYI